MPTTRDQRAFQDRILACLSLGLPSAIAFAAVEAINAERTSVNGLATWELLQSFAYVLPWFLLLALLLSGMASGCYYVPRRVSALGGPSVRDDARTDVLVALAPAMAIFAPANYLSIALLATNFENRKLMALLAVVVLFCVFGVSLAVWILSFFLLRTTRSRRSLGQLRAVQLLCCGALLVVGGGMVWHNWKGLRIIGGWLFAGPGAALVVAAGAYCLLHRGSWLPSKRFASSLVIASVAAGTAVSFMAPATVGRVIGGALWSAKLVTIARNLTDFDRDGYSSWFGGVDCAPLNGDISPGAYDVPDDGVDNDCLAGDATTRGQRGPTWYEMPPQVARPKNLVVISIEALRADRLWLSDHEPDITPNLRKLAASSTAFRRTYSASPSTIESLASLWSSQSPTEIQWEAGNLKQIAPETPWLPSTLDSNGYSTFAFLFHYKRFHKDKGVGFDRGFRVYDTSTLVGYAPGNFYGFPSGQVVDRAIEAIDRSFEPFLVWAHLAEPHAEYEQPPSAPVFGTSAEDRYAAEIWEADRQVGRVIEHLERSGLIEDTVVLITGDHGESFGDHGLTHHGKSLYEAQVRTLGLLRVPGVSARIVEQPVGHRDFGVTVMNLLGVRDGFERLSGVNLLPLVAGQPEQVRPVVLERLDADDRRPVLSGIVQWPFKLIHRHASASARLFNLEEDPGETTDISDDEPEALRLLTESFHGHLTRRPAPL